MRFAKLHGAGNDYIYVDARGQEADWEELARRVSDRHFGIGSDGLILLRESGVADARMQMFNSDGSEGMMCGNGIRCFIRFGLARSALDPKALSYDVETASGVLNVRPIWKEGAVTRASVSMGAPILNSSSIPVLTDQELERVLDHPLELSDTEFPVSCVSMGNPHAVRFLDEPVDDFPLTTIGPEVEHHSMFPARVNFEVVNLVSRNRIKVRVWERGSGITLACGTGACAAMVAAHLHGLVDDDVVVELPGGELTVIWAGHGDVTLEGPVAQVFEGDWPD